MTPPDPTEPGFRETDNIVAVPNFAKVDLSLRERSQPAKSELRQKLCLPLAEREVYVSRGLLSRPSSRRRSYAGLCGCAHSCGCAGRAPASRGDAASRDNS